MRLDSERVRAPRALAAVLLALTLLVLPRAGTVLGEHHAFLPAFLAAVLLLDGLSAWLLLAQFQATGRRRTLLFGLAYAWSLASVVPHVLVFPGVLTPTGLLGAKPSSAPWLWTSWHTGFALLVAAGCLPWRALDDQVVRRRLATAGGLGAVAAASAVWTWLVTAHAQDLPAIIQAGNYVRLAHTVGPWTISANAVALVAALLHARRSPSLERWFVPVAMASLGDVVLTLFARARFTVGWYTARALALSAAAVVLVALVGQMTAMYRQLESSASQLRVLADTDELTGLANRRALLSAGHALLAAGEGLSVAVVDADHFKQVNDRHGHEVGDQVLFSLAGRMSTALRGSDLLGRYGGEEFLVVLPGTDLALAATAAERVRAAVARAAVVTTAGALPVTVSVGVACAQPGDGLLDVVARADAALYRAKQEGRDRVVADDRRPSALVPAQPDRRTGDRPAAEGTRTA